LTRVDSNQQSAANDKRVQIDSAVLPRSIGSLQHPSSTPYRLSSLTSIHWQFAASLLHPFSTLLVLHTPLSKKSLTYGGSTLGSGRIPSTEPSLRTARQIRIESYSLKIICKCELVKSVLNTYHMNHLLVSTGFCSPFSLVL